MEVSYHLVKHNEYIVPTLKNCLKVPQKTKHHLKWLVKRILAPYLYDNYSNEVCFTLLLVAESENNSES